MKTIILNSIILLFVAISLSSCYKDILCTEGNGNHITKTLQIPEFSGIDFEEAGTVIISQGTTQHISVSGDKNIINKLKDDVHAGVWEISLGRGCFRDYDLEVHITVPSIDEIHLSGSGDIIVEDFENQNDLDLSISGSGTIDLDSFDGADKLSVKISGSGEIFAHQNIPNLDELDIIVSGSGRFEAYPIVAREADIQISGSGNCYVTTENFMDVHISGSGSVYYKGFPQISSNISGSGNIINAN